MANSVRRNNGFDLPFWLGLLLCLALYGVLSAGPILLSLRVHPWAGVAAAVLAIPAWMHLGPPPGPGFVPGILASGGLLALIVLALLALVRAVT